MKKIVIADDEKVVRIKIKNIINNSDIPIEEIIECENGEKAYDIIKSQKVDVLITDVDMPIIDGVTLVKKIKNLSNSPKVIVVSGYNDFYYAVDLLRCGVREYLLKPVNGYDIIKIMRQLEEEYLEEEIEFKDKLNLLYEQIRYSFFHENIEEDKFMNIQKNLRKQINKVKYILICTNYFQSNYISSDFFFYPNINGHNIILADPKNIRELVEGELKGYGLGLSSEFDDFNLLYLALKEGIKSREDNFSMKYETCHCIKQVRIIKDSEIVRVTQLIGTARLEEAYKYLRMLINSVKWGEIDLNQFENIIKEIIKKIKLTYEGIINEEFIDINSLLEVFNYNNIDVYSNELFKVLDIINKKLINEYSYYRNRIKIEQAIKYIYENYKSEINMTIVSNYVSMNYSVFSIDFKEYTGKNFVNYLKEVRLKEAKRLLDETDMKIIEISEAVGYENDKHFMKTFKYLYSVTPSEYRKNMKNGKNKYQYHVEIKK